jgi:hypothetical protein
MKVEVAQSRWIRHEPRTLGIGASLLLFGAFFVWMGLHLVIFRHSRVPISTGTKIGLSLEVLPIGVVFLYLSLREFRSGLWLDSRVVIVRGLIRTRRFRPDELDGFKPEMRLAPCPLLHCKHGSPVVVGALAHGGFVKSTNNARLADLEPVCGELNALLQTVQSAEAASTNRTSLDTRPEDRRENFGTLVRLFAGFACAVVAICVAVAVLVRTPAAIAVMAGIAVVDVIGTYVVLQIIRRELDQESSDPSTPESRVGEGSAP